MEILEQDNPLRVGLRRDQGPAPCAVVVFGATGDLMQRKLGVALYNLQLDRLLPGNFAIVGVGRSETTDDALAGSLRKGVEEHSRRPLEQPLWDEFARSVSYVRVRDESDYRALADHLERTDRERGTAGNRLFYLAVPPSAFPRIVHGLGRVGLSRPGRPGSWSRVVIEKPIGRDLASARELNSEVAAVFDEADVFRIDHYLGKETVQNLLVYRFANAINEPLWNHKYVDHVQITVAESIGVEGRGSYYEESGATRDMLQNHMFQLLCLTAMEPPVSLAAENIRNEKVKVLQALRPLTADQVRESCVRAQYGEGVSGGRRVPGYRQEPGVAADSRTESYVAMRLHVDNWRWSGVPFYLRSGKRLPKRVTEIALQYRDVPHLLFDQQLQPNTLVLRIQPDEGITMTFEAKAPGPRPQIKPVSMDFRYGTSFGQGAPEAYERLIRDAMVGDSTLFIRRDEVEASWGWVDPLLEHAADDDDGRLPEYTAGTWGPAESDVLLARDGRVWRRL